MSHRSILLVVFALALSTFGILALNTRLEGSGSSGISAAISSGAGPAPLLPTVFTVTRLDDPTPGACNPGDCSLREAIVAANMGSGPSTVSLPAGTIVLSIPAAGSDTASEGDLDIARDGVSIVGQGADKTIINGNGATTNNRVFQINAQGISMSGVSIRNGRMTGVDGGAIYVNPGKSLSLSNVALTDNTAVTMSGGAIYNNGTLTVTASLIANNSANQNGGGIFNDGLLTVTNSTFSGNQASSAGFSVYGGGGIINWGSNAVWLNNVTMAGNTAVSRGGGLYRYGSGAIYLKNTLIGSNTGATGPGCYGTLTSQGNNILANNSGCSGLVNGSSGDIVGTSVSPVDPKLGALQNNGGPTMTRALLTGSPAINAGNNATCAATDQRGYSRADGGPTCDIGAFEVISRKSYLPLVMLNSGTPPAPPAPPAAPTNVMTTVVSSALVNLTWTDASNNEDGFHVERALGGGSFAQVMTVGPNVTAANVSGLSASTTYRFRISAFNASGESYSSIVTATTLTPPAQVAPPSNLIVGASSPYTTTLDWTDNANNEDGFYIDLSTNHGATFTLGYGDMATPNVQSVDDSDRTPGVEYCYRIRAYKGAAASDPSNTACATTPKVSAPDAPTNVHTVFISTTAMLVTWTNMTSSTGSDGYGYEIYESDNGSAFGYIGTLSGYWDGVQLDASGDPYLAGHVYAYKVKAKNNYGVSSLSAASNSVTVPSTTSTTKTRFANHASYPVISLKIDGVEQFQYAPQGIPPNAEYRVELAAGTHTYAAGTGFWDGSLPYIMYTYSGTFTQQTNVTGVVDFNNPTAAQLMRRLDSAHTTGYWVGDYWADLIPHSKAFRFYNNGTYTLYQDGAVVGSGAYSIVSYPGNFNVTVQVGPWQAKLSELTGDFYMSNGPAGWAVIQYTYDGP